MLTKCPKCSNGKFTGPMYRSEVREHVPERWRTFAVTSECLRYTCARCGWWYETPCDDAETPGAIPAFTDLSSTFADSDATVIP
jgi:rubredoxin